MPDRLLRQAQGVGDAFPAPTPFSVQGKNLFLHLRWGAAGLWWGRRDRSIRPVSPLSWQRLTHSRTVLREMESLRAVSRKLPHSFQVSTIRSLRITLPSW